MAKSLKLSVTKDGVPGFAVGVFAEEPAHSRYAVTEFRVSGPAKTALVNELKTAFLPQGPQEALTLAGYAVDVVESESFADLVDATVGCALRVVVGAAFHSVGMGAVMPLVAWVDDLLEQKDVPHAEAPFTVELEGTAWQIDSVAAPVGKLEAIAEIDRAPSIHDAPPFSLLDARDYSSSLDAPLSAIERRKRIHNLDDGFGTIGGI